MADQSHYSAVHHILILEGAWEAGGFSNRIWSRELGRRHQHSECMAVWTFKTLGKTGKTTFFFMWEDQFFDAPHLTSRATLTGQTDGFNPVETCLAETWLQTELRVRWNRPCHSARLQSWLPAVDAHVISGDVEFRQPMPWDHRVPGFHRISVRTATHRCSFLVHETTHAGHGGCEELATLRDAALQGLEERAAHYAVTNWRTQWCYLYHCTDEFCAWKSEPTEWHSSPKRWQSQGFPTFWPTR